MSVNIFRTTIEQDKYFVVTYFLKARNSLRDAAWDLAIGQSIGNPNSRSAWETEEMFEHHSCIILADENELNAQKEGLVDIAFPVANIDWDTDGISQLLCHIAGGQVDILEIEECHVNNLQLPQWLENKLRLVPAYGITGFRKYAGLYEKPFFGGIVKPKIGMTPEVLLAAVKEMVAGGVNFIKEDELLGNPPSCPLEKRVPLITGWLKENAPNVIYCFCINADTPHVFERVKFIEECGGNGIHINVWSGLGIYHAIRKQFPKIFIHFQKSGDRFFTDPRSPYHIKWPVICKIAGLSGVDSIHAGMIGGYMNQDEAELAQALKVLWNYNVLPALSCGMHPGLVQHINDMIGLEWMANCGGAMHGHPSGTKAGGLAMRQAIDKTFGEEYDLAIKKWGLGPEKNSAYHVGNLFHVNKDLQYRRF